VRDDSDEREGVRRIGRYILNGLTALSLILCVITVRHLETYAFSKWGAKGNSGLMLEAMGFKWRSRPMTREQADAWRTIIPSVLGVLPAAVITTMAIRRIRRLSPPAAPGLCPRCAYDLRATPDRCPECGMIPTKVKA
jgi:hypothetical protein